MTSRFPTPASPGRVLSQSGDRIRLQGADWANGPWQHDLVVCRPSAASADQPWLLHVTGGEPNDFDIQWSQSVAELSGCPVATLFQIPNQPFFELAEDELIAHTFERFLDTGDTAWPLLVPMVHSTLSAIEALRADRVVVFGASKRGWTSWLAAATLDPRIVGVAPMLFDHLNMPAQLEKQLRDWGGYSPMIDPYISRGLDVRAQSARGEALVRLVDPYTYLDALDVPVLSICGTNDPYWTLDASDLYWESIRGPKWSVYVPNLHHAFEMTDWWTPSLAAFMLHLSGGGLLASVPVNQEVFSAASPDRVFWDKPWSRAGATLGAYRASLSVAHHNAAGLEFRLTSRPSVLRC